MHESNESRDVAEHNDEPVGRRRLLRMGGLAAAGAAAAAVAAAVDASPAGATNAPMVYGTSMDSGTDETDLTSTNNQRTLLVENTGTGRALEVLSSGGGPAMELRFAGTGMGGLSISDFPNGDGVGLAVQLANPGNNQSAITASVAGPSAAILASTAGSGAAVEAETEGAGPGVFARSVSLGAGPFGPAIKATVETTFGPSSSDAVRVENHGSGIGIAVGDQGDGTGSAVVADLTNAANAANALVVSTAGTGRAIDAQITNAASSTITVNASTSGTGLGVNAVSFGGTALQAVSAASTAVPTVSVVAFSATAGGIDAQTGGSGTGVKSTSWTGTAIEADITNVASTANAIVATQGGKGAALVATTTAISVNPTMKATSGVAAQPAVQANGLAGTGAALDVHGKTTFTRSGVLTIPAGATSATTPTAVPGGLSAAAHVLATLQTTGTVMVQSAVPNTVTGKITVKLSAAAPVGGVKVAWFVIG